MNSQRWLRALLLSLILCHFAVVPSHSFAEDDSDEYQEDQQTEEQSLPQPPKEKKRKRSLEHRKFVTDHPDRSDAGIFHVAAAVGGNLWIEPVEQTSTTGVKTLTGEYYKDFGFQAGAYFDYDYSQMPENIPLMLRGYLGYKYVHSSAHVFSFEGVVRRMFNFSEDVTFGLGMGGSAALWYRTANQAAPVAEEQFFFFPSLLFDAGFEFNPFMVDFKWLINKIGADATVMGFELNFGFRL